MPATIELIRHTDSLFAENCYLLIGRSGTRAAIVDPGFESEALAGPLAERGLELEWIINTHGHLDHIARNAWFKERSGARLVIHRADLELLRNLQRQVDAMRALGLPLDLELPPSPEPDGWLEEGVPLRFDGVDLQVLHTPGHSPGGVCLRFGERMLVGDTLFQGSVGRTDLPGGSMSELVASIRGKLFGLPGATVCYPGHGAPTTLDAERRANPFVSDRAVGAGMKGYG
jgi:glyoxylase-like metal-dependent hydrolase (beta-lactamase superfamily II)